MINDSPLANVDLQREFNIQCKSKIVNEYKMNTLRNYESQFRQALQVLFSDGRQNFNYTSKGILKHPIFTAMSQTHQFNSNVWITEDDRLRLNAPIKPDQQSSAALIRLEPKGKVLQFWNLDQIQGLVYGQHKVYPALDSIQLRLLLENIASNFAVSIAYNSQDYMVKNNKIYLCESTDADLLNMELLQAVIIAACRIPNGNISLSVELTARLLAEKFNFEYVSLQPERLKQGWSEMTLREYEKALQNAKSLAYQISYRVLGDEQFHTPENRIYKTQRVSFWDRVVIQLSLFVNNLRV